MSGDPTERLVECLIRDIDERGPLPFSTFMNRALYDPELGFYERGGAAGGRRGHFVTSVETGPLFAAVVGEWLDRRWHELGRPDPFLVAEAAAGVGTLWRGIRRAAPACYPALHWILVERSARLRTEHDALPQGRRSTRAELPDEAIHVVLANELLDNLAFDIAERVVGGWRDVRVGHVDGAFAFVRGGRVADGPPGEGVAVGARIPVAVDALDWLARARAIAARVLVFDYGATTAELAERGIDGWLRTYVGHGRGPDPLERPGAADVTHDVPFDQLPTPRTRLCQAEWLGNHGIDDRVAAAREAWSDRAAIGDLEAMFARSAVAEAEALTDPAGLGGFTVLEW